MKWVVLILGEHMAISRVCLTLTLDCVRQRMQRCEMEASTRRGSILFILTANGECSIHIYSIPLYESYWIYRNCQKETKNCKLEKKKEPTTDFFFLSERKRGDRKGSNGNIFGGIHKLFLAPLVDPWFIIILWFFFIRSFYLHPVATHRSAGIRLISIFGIQFWPPFSYEETSIS